MSELIAIGYADMATAPLAMEEVEKLSDDLLIQPDAVAVIIRDETGKFKTITNVHAVGAGASYGMFWGLLFGLLFFVPFLGMAFGAGLGALMSKVEKTGIDRAFQDRIRDLLKPGTSALFMIMEKATPDRAVAALGQYGGTVIKSSLSEEAEAKLQEALHGKQTAGV
jgi:uncharacterized membrane protein